MALLEGNALVTGAGSGIGRCLSIAYIQAGARNVTLADINLEAAKETASMIKKKFPEAGTLEVAVDVVDEASVQSMVDQAVEAFGTLDYAANAAGVIVNARKPTAEYPIREYERVLAINTTGLLLCLQAELRAMVKQERKLSSNSWSDLRRTQRGSIVNFGSVSGFTAMPNILPYTVSKHAVLGITKTAACDHAADGIRVNAVCPGLVETPFLVSLRASQNGSSDTAPIFQNPMGRLCYPEEIADLSVFLSSTMSSYINGACIVSDGGRSMIY